MKKNWKLFTTASFLVLLIITLSLYFAEFLTERFYRLEISETYKNHSCVESSSQFDRYGRDAIYRDGGFRNETATREIANFDKIWADTICLNEGGTFWDRRGVRKTKKIASSIYAINDLGFRGSEWKRGSSEQKRLFLLGGSTAFSSFSTESNSLHSLIQTALNESEKGTSYVVYNGALLGGAARDEYKILTNYVGENDPDTVIFLTGLNNSGRDGNDDRILNVLQKEGRISQEASYGIGKVPLVVFKKVTETLRAAGMTNLSDLIMTVMLEWFDKNLTPLGSFLKYSNLSNAYCKERKIRCIFVLQPTLLVPRYILSQDEQRVRDQIKNHGKLSIRKFNDDYTKIKAFFEGQSHDFEWHDLTDIGAFSGEWIQGHGEASTNLSRLATRAEILLSSESNLQKKETAFIGLDSLKLRAEKCQLATVHLKGREFKYSCRVTGAEHILAVFGGPTVTKGYENIVVRSIESTPVEMNFHIPSGTNKTIIEVGLKNFKNKEDIPLKMSWFMADRLSGRKSSFSEYSNGLFLFEIRYPFALEKEENLRLEFHFPVDQLIGLSSVTISAIGRSVSDIRSGGGIIMRGSDISMLQRDSRLTSEVYIDGAHLTPLGNTLVADRLVQILAAGAR